MKIKRKDLIYDTLLLAILLNNIICQYVSLFSYFDEILEFVCIVDLLCHIKQIRLKEIKCIIILAIVLFIGFLGYLINGYQSNIIAVIKDIALFLKFPVTVMAMSLRVGRGDNKVNSKHIINIILIYTLILFVCGVVSVFTNIGMSQNYDIRFGIAPFQFFYSHPTFLVYTLVFMSIVLIGNIENSKKYLGLQIMLLILMILTMRDKAFAYVALYILFIFVIPNRKRIKPAHFVFAGVIALIISYNKIQEYVGFLWSPRFAMYSTAIKIMMDKFPLGSGLASFGSSISGEYYSNLYYVYGIATKMGPDNIIGFSDSQWPYYFGQFGLIGGLLFVYLLWELYMVCKSRINDKMALRPIYLMFGYLIIASLVESIFTNESGATICFSVLMFSNNINKVWGSNIK